VTALIGANGAGKSTTLKAISGLVRPAQGTILFQGTSLVGLAPHRVVRLGVAHVPEERKIFPDMTVEENLLLAAFTVTQRTEITKRLMGTYDLLPVLSDRKAQLGGTLSGGEQQLLAIGRGLMAKPKVLLLDEPFLGLSPVNVQTVAQIIRTLADRGIAILLVEQNARMALALATWGFVLERGALVASGTGTDLARDPRVLQAFLGGSAPGP
jgi:branched-chain amino acid transport system ATP-binding protein